MGYHVIDPGDVDPAPGRPSETRFVSTAAGLSKMGLRWYRVQPGEDIPITGLHYHDEQEEAFYVARGSMRAETPEQEYRVEEGSFFIAEPESPHRVFNSADATEDAIVVAVGAPAVNDGHAYDQ